MRHSKWAGIADVNVGSFMPAWDHLIGTFSFDPDRHVSGADLGLAENPDHPVSRPAQMAQPARASGGCAQPGPIEAGPKRRV